MQFNITDVTLEQAVKEALMREIRDKLFQDRIRQQAIDKAVPR